ncbi:MAG TPA: hypothetical protein VFX48_07630 [Saprospiraceae bacterium]|nr:hypothetical protein [Saprospiraceae bacterium]
MLLRKFFYILLGCGYIVLGSYVWYYEMLPSPWYMVFGIACMAYGLFRVYRGYQWDQDA